MALLIRSAPRWTRSFGCLVAAIVLAATPPVQAQVADERQIHAVFLLHLARFVRWPETAFAAPDAPLVVGVIGNAGLARTLAQTVRNEKVGARPIQVRELRSAGEISSCHLVFLESSDVRTAAPAIAASHRLPVLLVSDAEGFLNLGGHVQFYPRGGQMKIRVAPENLKDAHLTPSAQLLRIAGAVASSGK